MFATISTQKNYKNLIGVEVAKIINLNLNSIVRHFFFILVSQWMTRQLFSSFNISTLLRRRFFLLLFTISHDYGTFNTWNIWFLFIIYFFFLNTTYRKKKYKLKCIFFFLIKMYVYTIYDVSLLLKRHEHE